VEDPIRGDVARAELGELGLKYFVDVRTTARRLLESMRRPKRAAFAASAAERLLREDESLPASEHRAYLATWRPVLDTVWGGLAGDEEAGRGVCRAVAHYYLTPEYHERQHENPADADGNAIMAVFYSAECFLHGCLEFAAWAGWRAFDAATVRAASDRDWPHRRPPDISAYSWELAHPTVQAELDRQMEDLELLDEAGEVPPVDQLRNMVERTVNPWPG
jgi:hypothetical protein